jgi:hypothetical protein
LKGISSRVIEVHKYFVKILFVTRNLGGEISSFWEVLIPKLRAFSLKVKLKLGFEVLLRAYVGRTVPEEGS